MQYYAVASAILIVSLMSKWICEAGPNGDSLQEIARKSRKMKAGGLLPWESQQKIPKRSDIPPWPWWRGVCLEETEHLPLLYSSRSFIAFPKQTRSSNKVPRDAFVLGIRQTTLTFLEESPR
jgi:hypothetical protein